MISEEEMRIFLDNHKKKTYKYKLFYGNKYFKNTEYSNFSVTEEDKREMVDAFLKLYQHPYLCSHDEDYLSKGIVDYSKIPNDYWDSKFFYVKTGNFRH